MKKIFLVYTMTVGSIFANELPEFSTIEMEKGSKYFNLIHYVEFKQRFFIGKIEDNRRKTFLDDNFFWRCLRQGGSYEVLPFEQAFCHRNKKVIEEQIEQEIKSDQKYLDSWGQDLKRVMHTRQMSFVDMYNKRIYIKGSGETTIPYEIVAEKHPVISIDHIDSSVSNKELAYRVLDLVYDEVNKKYQDDRLTITVTFDDKKK